MPQERFQCKQGGEEHQGFKRERPAPSSFPLRKRLPGQGHGHKPRTPAVKEPGGD